MPGMKPASSHFPGLIRIALVLIVLAVPILYSGSSAALRADAPRARARASAAAAGAVPAEKAGVPSAPEVGALGAPLSATPLWAAFQASLPEDVGSYAADCVTPKTSFAVNEEVCAKASGTPLEPRVIYWIGPEGFIVQTDVVSQTTPTAKRVVATGGPWRLYLSSGLDGTLRKAAHFSVKNNAQQPAANLTIVKSIDRNLSGSTADSIVIYKIIIENLGPDAASNVVFTEQPPNDAFFLSSSRDLSSGQVPAPTFSCTGNTCAISSFAPGDVATFIYGYQINPGAPAGTEIVSAATVASETDELDAGDNSSTTSLSVTEGVAPAGCVLECPNNITVSADTTQDGQRGAIVTFGAAESFGDCGTVNASPASGSFFPVGQNTVSVSAGAGGCSFTVTVIDDVQSPPPVITCPADKGVPPTLIFAANGAVDAPVDPGTPTTAGTVLSVVGVRSDGVARAVTDPYPVGETTITWTARDQAPDQNGVFPPNTRSASCQQKIVVTSNDAPTISCPADKNFDAPAGECEVTLTAAQIGSPAVTGAGLVPLEPFDEETGVGVVAVRSDRLPLSAPFPGGETVITWTATDTAGRVASCTQVITVNGNGGNTPPALEVPPDVEVLTDSCTALVDDELGVATAKSACGLSVKISRTGVPTRIVIIRGVPVVRETFVFPVGTTVITYKATDSSGNVTTGTQRVVVRERSATPPTIQAPPDLVLQTGADAASCGLNVSDAALGAASANDNCPGVTVARSGVPAGNFFPVGVTEVTYTATDASGNTAQATQKVTVADNTPPVVVPPPDITAFLPLNTPDTSVAVTYPTPATATDNCGGAVDLSYSPVSGSVFNLGPHTVTVTATDARGNTAQATFTVTVLYNFAGFFSPVSNTPAYNNVTAGRTIPLKFSLSGDKGLGIFAAGSPSSQQIACDSSAPLLDLEGTVTTGGSTLDYTPDQYQYNWKTESSWAGTCRVLVLKLNDGKDRTALFKFK
jgi:uncharacterized repeat protein (TIGR01451 family)